MLNTIAILYRTMDNLRIFEKAAALLVTGETIALVTVVSAIFLLDTFTIFIIIQRCLQPRRNR